MMLAEPQPTPADIDFQLVGIPVRISGWFWVGAVVLGWGACQGFARGDQRGLLHYLAIWIASVLVSLLVHEMGHALAYRRFGQSARIVLSHFGGLAIPGGWDRGRRLRPWERFVVSAAGPVAQLLFAVAIIAVLRLGGWIVPFPINSIGEALGLFEGRLYGSRYALAFADFLLYVNILWPLLNLMPVPPLDGGQMVREGLEVMGARDAGRLAAIVGAVTGFALALWAYSNHESYLALMFGLLAVSCVQSLQQGTPWKRWN